MSTAASSRGSGGGQTKEGVAEAGGRRGVEKACETQTGTCSGTIPGVQELSRDPHCVLEVQSPTITADTFAFPS